jgi:chorismate synthase
MIARIKEIKKEGNTIGGTITCVIKNVPVGIGEPIFSKLQAELAKAMLNINACKGFEYGSGFCGAKMTGKEHNDLSIQILPQNQIFQEEFRVEFPTEWIFISVWLSNLWQRF